MTSLSEISVTPTPVPQIGEAPERSAASTSIPTWSPIELPQARRPTSRTLVVLAVCAGVGALVLGASAGVSSLSGSAESSEASPSAVAADPVERRALTLLAKPSTERVVFRGSAGTLVLAVGSGGRAAILIRDAEHVSAGQPSYAWVVGGGRLVRAARLDGAGRAVFLGVPLAAHESVIVARKRPKAQIGSTTQLVALRG